MINRLKLNVTVKAREGHELVYKCITKYNDRGVERQYETRIPEKIKIQKYVKNRSEKNLLGVRGLRRIRHNDIMITDFLCTLKECRLSNNLVKGKQENKYCTAPGISITVPDAPIVRVHVTRR